MKTYKLNGLEYYTCASNKKDACEIFWLYKIGVTHNDILETDITPNKDAVGKVFKSLKEYNSIIIMKYKLIKEYPGSYELGAIALKRKESLSYSIRVTPEDSEGTFAWDYIRKEKIENYPEFWKKID
jgi:hypothetical protein